jgi:hypothetical protein
MASAAVVSFNTARIDHLYEDPHAGGVPAAL